MVVAEVAALQGNVVDNGGKQKEKRLKQLNKLLKKLTKGQVIKKNLQTKKSLQMKVKVEYYFHCCNTKSIIH